ncbi:MAG TPA: insulinase family protein [Cyclobacteriaceae bacterium]|nr:insulinase family protein [Cyclobacteriaceae bacterium]
MRTIRILFLLFLVNVSFAQVIPVAPEIKKGTLPNGLTYYIRHNSKPEKKVELRLVIKAGSILENDDQQGLAHFTEHMAFNGSKHFKKNDLVSFLQSIGVEFGADLNAYTGFDETVYILPIPTDKPGNLEQGFLALEDWASTVAFDATEIDKERGIVLEEARRGKGANDRMNKVIFPKLFEGSQYAKRLPIGTDQILKTFKPEVIKKFYKDWYRPDLMAVVAVGDIDPVEGEKLVRKHFEQLKNPKPERPREYATVPARQKSEGLVVTDKEATNHILQIYYSYKPVKAETTMEDYRASIVKGLFNSMLNLRLQELTQKADPPFLYGGSSLSGFVKGYEVYGSLAVIGKAGVEPAMRALMEENDRARKFGFTAGELDRIKRSFTRNLERAYNERDKTDSENYADEYIRNFVEDEPIPGIENEFEYFKKFSETITLDEINAYAAKIIPGTTETKLVILNGPEQSAFKMPTGSELLALAEKASSDEIKAYEEKELSTSLMAAPPATGKIINEKLNDKVGFTEITLSNNVKVILKSTDFKNDQVLMNATRFGGQSVFPTKDQHNAAYASTIVSQMGIKDFMPSDIRKMLAGKSVSVAPRLGLYSEGISGQCGSSDVETMLQLVYLYFTSPRKDEELFKSFVSKQQSALENVMSNPQAVYQDSLQSILYQHHPRGPRVPRTQDFNSVTLDRSLQIYHDRFSNANGFTFCIVGSFDMAKMKELVTSYLGSLPSGQAVAGMNDLGIRPVKGVVKKEVKRGAEEKSVATMIFTGETTWSAQAAIHMQALMDVLDIKLTETLREDLAGVYSASIRGQVNKNPYGHYMITATIPCGPENVDKLINATLGEIRKIKDNGPTVVDLNKVKETWIKQYQEGLKENGYWLSRLLQSVEAGTDPADILTGDQRINAITPNDVKAAANKFFDMNNYFQMVLNPEKGG